MIYEIDAIDALESFASSTYFPGRKNESDVNYSIDTDQSQYTVMCYISKDELTFDNIEDAIKNITEAFKKFVENEKYPEELLSDFNVTDTTQTDEYVLEITNITFDESTDDADYEDPDVDYEYNEDDLRIDENNVLVTQISALTKPDAACIVDGKCENCGEDADENHVCSKVISTDVVPTLENTFVTSINMFKELYKK